VPHYSRLAKLVIDVPEADHEAELRFWEAAVGQTLKQNNRQPEYHGAMLPGGTFGLLVQRLGEGSSRIHLDIHTSDLDAEVTRLEGLGAVRERYVNSLWIMRDPAGMPFCVIPARPGSLDDGNAQRWD
jgi:Glyoxalase-like domain